MHVCLDTQLGTRGSGVDHPIGTVFSFIVDQDDVIQLLVNGQLVVEPK